MPAAKLKTIDLLKYMGHGHGKLCQAQELQGTDMECPLTTVANG